MMQHFRVLLSLLLLVAGTSMQLTTTTKSGELQMHLGEEFSSLGHLLNLLATRHLKGRVPRCMAVLTDSHYIGVTPRGPTPLFYTSVRETNVTRSFTGALRTARFEGCTSVVILLQNGRLLARLIKKADRLRLISSKIRLVLPYDPRLFELKLHEIWRRLVNVIFLEQTTRGNHKCYLLKSVSFPEPVDPDHPETWLPQSLDQWCFGRGIRDVFRDKTKDLMGKPLRVIYYKHMPSVVQVPSEIEMAIPDIPLHGVEIELVSLLSRALKFTPLLQETSNKSSGVMSAMSHADLALAGLPHVPFYLRQFDLSEPYAVYCFTFLTPEALGDRSWQILYLPLSPELWLVTGVAFIIIWIAMFLIARSQAERSVLAGPVTSLLHTWSMQFLVSIPSPPHSWPLRLLFGCAWLHCLLLAVSYRASFASLLATPPPRVAVDTLSQLADSPQLQPLTWTRHASFSAFLVMASTSTNKLPVNSTVVTILDKLTSRKLILWTLTIIAITIICFKLTHVIKIGPKKLNINVDAVIEKMKTTADSVTTIKSSSTNSEASSSKQTTKGIENIRMQSTKTISQQHLGSNVKEALLNSTTKKIETKSNKTVSPNNNKPTIPVNVKQNSNITSKIYIGPGPNITTSQTSTVKSSTTKAPPTNYNFYHLNISYLSKCENKCKGEDKIDLVIMIRSFLARFSSRMAIRQTYGNETAFPQYKIRKVFIMGIDLKNDSARQTALVEQEEHGDIILANFTDDYLNNSIKNMLGINWAREYCPKSRFYVIANDDAYISTKNLFDFINNEKLYNPMKEYEQAFLPDDPDNPGQIDKYKSTLSLKLFGGYLHNSTVNRDGVLKVLPEEFSLQSYPLCLSNHFFLMSRQTLDEFSVAARYVRFFRIDDVYMSYIAMRAGITPVQIPGVTGIAVAASKIENFDKIVASQFINPQILINIYKQQKDRKNA